MTRLEQLKIDLTTKEGFERAMCFCPHQVDATIKCYEEDYCRVCSKCRVNFLFSEVPMKKVKRWETFNGDFRKASKVFAKSCDGSECLELKDACAHCFASWLMEEIEVEE